MQEKFKKNIFAPLGSPWLPLAPLGSPWLPLGSPLALTSSPLAAYGSILNVHLTPQPWIWKSNQDAETFWATQDEVENS